MTNSNSSFDQLCKLYTIYYILYIYHEDTCDRKRLLVRAASMLLCTPFTTGRGEGASRVTRGHTRTSASRHHHVTSWCTAWRRRPGIQLSGQICTLTLVSGRATFLACMHGHGDKAPPCYLMPPCDNWCITSVYDWDNIHILNPLPPPPLPTSTTKQATLSLCHCVIL